MTWPLIDVLKPKKKKKKWKTEFEGSLISHPTTNRISLRRRKLNYSIEKFFFSSHPLSADEISDSYEFPSIAITRKIYRIAVCVVVVHSCLNAIHNPYLHDWRRSVFTNQYALSNTNSLHCMGWSQCTSKSIFPMIFRVCRPNDNNKI